MPEGQRRQEKCFVFPNIDDVGLNFFSCPYPHIKHTGLRE
jgi:hypothetical protein